MREIKFRAWDKKNEMWFADNLCIGLNGKLVWILGVKDFDYSKFDIDLMQFTGLKDKNSKEIYEGDIIRISEKYFPEEVKFQEITDPELGNVIGYGYEKIWELMEVIGNIYENPELLKDSQ